MEQSREENATTTLPEQPPSSPSPSESSDNGSDDSSASPGHAAVEWLATGRSKRSTAGNRMKSMLANEEPDSDLELLFAEDDDDVGFSDAEDAGSDVQMDSSSDSEDDKSDGDLEGEKELERQSKEKIAAQRKRKAQAAIPARFRKKVRINERPTPAGDTKTAPRPKKKSERTSWLPTAADLPTRASARQTTVLSKEQLHQQMIEREAKRLKQVQAMERKAKKLEALKKPPMTQAQRLEEAAMVEATNAKSLNRWEEAEKAREEERKAKLAALNDRTLEGPVVTFWSGCGIWTGDEKGGRTVFIEEKPRKKREKKEKPQKTKDTGKDEAEVKAGAKVLSAPAPPADDTIQVAKPPVAAETELVMPPPEKPAEAQQVPEVIALTAPNDSTSAQGSLEMSHPSAGKDPDPPSTTIEEMEKSSAGVPPAASPSEAPPRSPDDHPRFEAPSLPASSEVAAAIAPPAAPSSVSPTTTRSPVLAPPVLAPPLGGIHFNNNPANSKSNVLAPPNPGPLPTTSLPRPSQDDATTAPPTGHTQIHDLAASGGSAQPSEVPPSHETPRPSVEEPRDSQPTQDPSPTQQQDVKPPLPAEKTTRHAIILQNFDETLISEKTHQLQVLFGCRKLSKQAKPSPTPLCVITNQPARYRDPQTGLPFFNSYAYREIQKLSKGEYRFSALMGAWAGNGHYAARGVPARFLNPSAPGPRKVSVEGAGNGASEQTGQAAAGDGKNVQLAASGGGGPAKESSQAAGTQSTIRTEDNIVAPAPVANSGVNVAEGAKGT